MSTHAPVLFIGLDGAEPELLRRWMANGDLPVLASLAARGCSRTVTTLPGMGDGAVWPTLITGVNPGRHGRYFRRQVKAGSYQRKLFDVESELEYRPFWLPLSEAGNRVAILDLPYTPSAKSVNGLLLTDWLIHDRYGQPRGYPGGFAEQVIARIGDDPLLGNSDQFGTHPDQHVWLLQRLLDRVAMKERLLCDTLAGGQWDLMATAFAEPHDAGHRLWHYHDAHHPAHDAAWKRRLGDPLKTLYARIDTAIGRIVDRADDEVEVVVFAGLGMGPDYTANEVLEQVLLGMEGMAELEPTRLTRSKRLPRLLKGMSRRYDALRWRRQVRGRRFFAVPHNENSGAVRLNVSGREPAGIVPQHAFDDVLHELSERLFELVDADSGEPIVSEVIRVADHYHGECLAELPDMLVLWNRQQPFASVSAPYLSAPLSARSWGRTGDHTSHAMMITAGPVSREVDLADELAVVDVAPTIAALRGVELSDGDGESAWLRVGRRQVG